MHTYSSARVADVRSPYFFRPTSRPSTLWLPAYSAIEYSVRVTKTAIACAPFVATVG